MKKTAFMLKAVMYLAGISGCVLGAMSAVVMANNNAQWDYHNNSSRQLFGWLLCFVPMVVALLSTLIHFVVGKKRAGIKSICICTAFVSAIMPAVYILVFNHYSFYRLLSACLVMCFALIALSLRLLIGEKAIEEADSDLNAVVDMVADVMADVAADNNTDVDIMDIIDESNQKRSV